MHVRICALIAFLVVALHAQNQNAGSAEFAFLRNFQAARPAGLAGAGASLEGGLQFLGLNPAGMARTNAPWVEASARRHIQSYQSGMIAYSHPFLTGTATGQIAYLDEGDPIQEIDENNTATGRELRPNAWMISASFSEPLGAKLAWGATMRFVHEFLDIDDAAANALSMDLGLILQPGSRRFTYGLALNNLGTKLSGHTRTETEFGDLPLAATGSVRALLTRDGSSSAILDVQKPVDNYIQCRLGLEQKVVQSLTIRGGLRTDEREILDIFNDKILGEEALEHEPSMALRAALGASFTQSNWTVDYAWQGWGPLGSVHFLTFGMSFGRPPRLQETSTP
jgi:hypothetical protein